MNHNKILLALVGMLAVVCWKTDRDAHAQSDQARAGDGKITEPPKSTDSIRIGYGKRKLTLKEVEDQWDGIDRENTMRHMGTIRHSAIVELLYRAAIADPTLYKKRLPTSPSDGEMAIWAMIRTKEPAVPVKLAAILRAPMEGVDPGVARKIKGKAAQELLRFKTSDKQQVYETLDNIAAAGDIYCPYPPPGSFYRGNGTWIDPPTDNDARELLRKWLGQENRIARLEAARCAAEAGVQDQRIRPLAEAELQREQLPPENPSREWHVAEQILKALAAHGDKQADEKRDRIEMEREIRRGSAGNPSAEKSVREHAEKQFKKKWAK